MGPDGGRRGFEVGILEVIVEMDGRGVEGGVGWGGSGVHSWGGGGGGGPGLRHHQGRDLRTWTLEGGRGETGGGGDGHRKER